MCFTTDKIVSIWALYYLNKEAYASVGVCVGVWVGGGLCVRLCVRHASKYGKLFGMVEGDGAPKAQEYVFQVSPPKVTGHPEVKLLWKCPSATKFDRNDPSLGPDLVKPFNSFFGCFKSFSLIFGCSFY